jgi:hypothetical protein
MCAVERLRTLMARQSARLITNPPIESSWGVPLSPFLSGTVVFCSKDIIFFAKSTFFHVGQREKKSFFMLKLPFFTLEKKPDLDVPRWRGA